MDTVLDDIEKLVRMARKAEQAPPLAAMEIMRRIDGSGDVTSAMECESALPIRFMIGVASVAAVFAVITTNFAHSAWERLSDPVLPARFLPDVLSFFERF